MPVALGAVRLEHRKQASSLKIARGEQRQAVLLLVESHTKVSVHLHPVALLFTSPELFPTPLQVIHNPEGLSTKELVSGHWQAFVSVLKTNDLRHAHSELLEVLTTPVPFFPFRPVHKKQDPLMIAELGRQ